MAALLLVPSTGEACPRPDHHNPAWRLTAASLETRSGQTAPVVCPPGGHLYRVWGNNPYTIDSSVCSAAVHAGLITVKDGGSVRVKVRFSKRTYTGNYRNGVSSASYTTREGSFSFPAALIGLPAQRRPPPDPDATTWSTTINELKDQAGERFSFNCPAGGAPGSVWGNNPYTSDTSICTAAVHAGLITLVSGGAVVLEVAAGRSSYGGNHRNGVTSRSYGSWGSSFFFPAANRALPALPAPPRDPGVIRWNTTASQLGAGAGQTLKVRCPAGGRPGMVWGNNPYTGDSSICGAAVHAGLIHPRRGGMVVLEGSGRQSAFVGTVRHGVTSRGYGAWGNSFYFPSARRALPTMVEAEQ